jgi:hypothetical protein
MQLIFHDVNKLAGVIRRCAQFPLFKVSAKITKLLDESFSFYIFVSCKQEALDYGYEHALFFSFTPIFTKNLNPLSLVSLKFTFEWTLKNANAVL